MKPAANSQEAEPQAGTADNDQLVWGATNIARIINRDVRQTYYLHEKKLIPTRVIGGRLVGLRSKLMSIAD
jgi:hypothetical protein